MDFLKTYLDGKKTHLVALGVVLTAVGGLLSGDLTLLAAITQTFAGLGLSALRMGVAKK